MFEFDKYFDYICLSCDHGVKKPDPKIIEVILEKFPEFEKE